MRSARGGRIGPGYRQRRHLIGVAALVAGIVLSGCAVGPESGPDLVPGDGNDNPATTTSVAPPPPPPALAAPKQDLKWRPCAAEVAGAYSVGAPAGMTVECATFDSPIDPARPDDAVMPIAATRLRTASTPPTAAPLVLTSGSDLPSSRTLLMLADGAGAQILRTHPIVAIDRRGIPRSKDLDCMTRIERANLVDNGFNRNTASSDSARISALASSASSASDSCTETLTPYQLNFSISFAASDLETLRRTWGVEHLGIVGVGEGSDVALAYASLYPGRAGRLILDTPTPFGMNARDRALARATWVQTGLQTFAQRCATVPGCAFGTDGLATMQRLIDRAGAGRLGALSDTQALAAITTAVATADAKPDALVAVSSAIVAADRGDTGALTALASRAAQLRLNDGAIVATCNDVIGPVGQSEIPGLIDAWSRQSSLTGADAALSLLRCNGWPPAEGTRAPTALPTAPLVLSGSNDTINGGSGAAALKPLFMNLQVAPVTVTWDGLGYSVLARSSCAADVVAEYVDRAPLTGQTQRGCPA
ncbi:alpha/beta fold hydrolase [Gordonia sp. ABSL1-1]|uniref:alpha/beta fold hydrolase n=1 Tax=Gordonia sp. ABSL1-1 TaxID=3053923 RepID=UPI0025722B24|nr:alpha/beta fold hydrolase [Gordonia sp. ABSL1-1]MDL9936409.1 alpha/beta fold hydrolase [Gordonia sp. ABSL1-1]